MKQILISLMIVSLVLINGCGSSSFYYGKCNEGKSFKEKTDCSFKEEVRLKTIELYKCHKEICDDKNLSVYVYNEVHECSCVASFIFIDEVTGIFVEQIDKNKMVKCWNKTSEEVSVYHFDDLLNERGRR